MNRSQIENLYEVNGLTNYKLRNTEDLLKTHGINFKAVDGYDRLDDINKALYEKFIVNIYNAFGLESRAALIPKGIYFVEDTELLVKENPNDDCFIIAGGIVKAIDRNGVKWILHSWNDEDYKELPVIEEESKNYLRFEYEHEERKEWLHVIKDGKEWY